MSKHRWFRFFGVSAALVVIMLMLTPTTAGAQVWQANINKYSYYNVAVPGFAYPYGIDCAEVHHDGHLVLDKVFTSTLKFQNFHTWGKIYRISGPYFTSVQLRDTLTARSIVGVTVTKAGGGAAIGGNAVQFSATYSGPQSATRTIPEVEMKGYLISGAIIDTQFTVTYAPVGFDQPNQCYTYW